jgi:hypothetical protein
MIEDVALSDAVSIVASVEAEGRDVVALAELVSIAVRVEPELLRTIRLKMLPKSHAGIEADLWFSRLVESRSPGGFVFDGDVAQVLRGRLRATPERLSTARASIKAMHLGISPAIELEEELTFAALAPLDAKQRTADIQAGLRRALKTMVTEESRETNLARWALRAIPRLPEDVRDSAAGWLLALSAGARLDGREVMSGEPPQGAVDDLQALLPTKSEPVTIGARLVASGVELSYPADPRSHAIQVPNTTPIVVSIGGDGGPRRRQSTLRWDEVRVVSTQGRTARIETAAGAVIDLAAPVPDMTIRLVTDADKPDLMHLSFASLIGEQSTTIQLSSAQIADVADRILKGTGPGSNLELRGLGRQIADFLPPEFWSGYARLVQAVVDRVPTVLLLTDQALVPWELAVVPDSLSRSSGRAPFLGAEVDFGTWIMTSPSAVPTPFALDISSIVVVAATGDLNLPGAVGEVDDLVIRYGATRIEPSLEGLKPWIDGRYQPDVLHLAGVAATGSDLLGSIPMKDGNLDEKTLVGARLDGAFVFLNLDSVGRAGGLISALLASGAAGVIATPSRIDDLGGREAASTFYERVFRGTSPAAVLRTLRQEAIDASARDQTALSYRYFGHPSTTLTLGYAVSLWDITKGEVVGSLVGHKGPIRSIDYSADGSLIVTGSDDGTARVWRAATGRQLYSFVASTVAVWRVAFSPDGSRIVALSNDERISVFALGAGIQLTVGPGAETGAIAWSPSGDRIAYVDRNLVGIFDPMAGGRISGEVIVKRPTAIAWSGRRLVVADGDGSLIVFDDNGSGRPDRVGVEITPISALSAVPGSPRVASVDSAGAIGIWDLSDRRFVHLGSAPSGVVQSLRVVGDQVLAVSDLGFIVALGLIPGDALSFPPIAANQGAVLAPDGSHVATFTRYQEPGPVPTLDRVQPPPPPPGFSSEPPRPEAAPPP